jgi:excisionase family DNA binding protein
MSDESAPPEVPAHAPTAQDVAALPEILMADQAAWLLRLTIGQLEAAAKRGEIPAAKVGRTRRYSKTALIGLVRGDQG